MGFAYPDISPIMFELGPLVIRWYSMAYLVGLLLGWWWVNRLVKKYDLKLTVQNVEDLVFIARWGLFWAGVWGMFCFTAKECSVKTGWRFLPFGKAVCLFTAAQSVLPRRFIFIPARYTAVF